MPKIPVVKPRRLVAALLRLGFVLDRQRGAHAMYRHDDGRMTIVPMHPGDIPPGTLRGILEDIEVTVDQIKEVL